MRTTGILSLAAVLLATALPAALGSTFTFWGIEMGQENHIGPGQLSFTGVGDPIQFVVAGTSYTSVNGTWFGPFDPPSPGFDYDEYPAFDTQAVFFYSDPDSAHFALIGGMDPGGVTFADGGYGDREFGPGDLYLAIEGVKYGIGLRSGGLYWVNGDHVQMRIYRADTGEAAPPDVRTAGTIGDVERDPVWYHVDHAGLAPCDPEAYAFFRSGSGALAGHATVDIRGTGVHFGAYESYLYEVSIPWTALGYASRPLDTSLGFHWAPDCGNDIIMGTMATPVPEPAAVQMAGILLGICGLGLARYKR
jgi:hypothetical protein